MKTMIARISSTMRKMFLPPGFSPRCSRRTANQPMQMKIIDVTTLGTMSNQSGPCDGAASGYAVANRIARATMYQNGFVLWGGTFGSRGMTTSNENKMSDGGRGRASLGVKVWKSSQKVEGTTVRRSLHRMVRSLWVYWRPWRNNLSAAP